ncbi:LysR family transcriptional regulator [Streptomyces eurythermus]|uniref:LysR family transcriptional regulator n=1 Tax=Streptomyces eurythermus TaxID=42237 RepID=UPI00279AFDA3|nr:LysR family transcriptional regulator [Streptomyces lavenduligriseus]
MPGEPGRGAPFTGLRQAEYFLAVVDSGGITAAARRLHVAQPSLSQTVRAIERQAGAELFERTPRGVVPTPAGRALVEPARRLLAARRAAGRAVSDVASLRAGRLELVAHASVAADPLARAVGRFRRAHPGVGVLVEDAPDDDELVYALADGRHELAVVSLPLPPAPDLVTEELGHHDIWLAMAPGTAIAPGPVSPAEVSAMPLVAVLHGGSARHAIRRALADAGQEEGTGREEGTGHQQSSRQEQDAGRDGDSREPARAVRSWAGVVTPRLGSVIPLVLTGAGAALVDRWYAERIAEQGGVVRPLGPPVRAPFGVARRREPLSPACRVFLEILRETCAARSAGGPGPGA